MPLRQWLLRRHSCASGFPHPLMFLPNDSNLRAFLDGEPLVELDGTQFAKADTPLTERVPEWYMQNGYTAIAVEGIGVVQLDKQAIQNTLSYGIGREKVIAFSALPIVLARGRITHSEPMRGSTTGGQVYHVAGPVRIGSADFICVVLVKADENLARMYVHEVFKKEELRRSAFKTGAVAAEQVAGKRAGSAEAGAIRRVLYRLYAVNRQAIDAEAVQPDRIAP